MKRAGDRIVSILQFCTVSVMWIFAAAITLWVLQLARVAYSLKDAFTSSVAITLVALPVFWALATILTYTFFGLRRGRRSIGAALGAATDDGSDSTV